MSSPDAARALGNEPPVASRFLFEVDGVEIGLFASVRGLAVSSQTEDVKEGGQNGFVHHLPGRLEWPNIVFSRGLTQSDALFDWMNKTAGEGFSANSNKMKRSTGAITAIASNGDRLRTWSLDSVFPVRWKGPDFDTMASTTLSEELEVAHHGFKASNVSA